MKNLQEVWDRIGTLETQNKALQNASNLQQQLLGVLLESQKISAPWRLSTVDSIGDVGLHTSLAFTPGSQPAISYYSKTNTDLKYAVFNGSTWQITPVDIDPGIVGEYTSLAFTPGGQPAISYHNQSKGELKYAVFNGFTWQLTTVESAGAVGKYTSLAFAPSGRPAISYYNGQLRYAAFDGAAWQLTTADSGNVGLHTSLAFAPNGLPAISYSSVSSFGVKYAEFDGVNYWLGKSVVNADAQYTSLAFTPGGQPAISYYDNTSHHLNYLVFNPATDAASAYWQLTQVDTVGDVGEYMSLAFTPGGQPAISYFDRTNGDLKFAIKAPFSSP